MARTDIQMNIRLPETLKTMLERAAEASGQSVTAEIVYRLEASFPENVAYLLLRRRQEELDMIKSQLKHDHWMESQLETIGDKAGSERISQKVGQLEHQQLALQNDIDRLMRTIAEQNKKNRRSEAK